MPVVQWNGNILNNISKPGFELLNKILVQFSDLNARWLLSGQESMTKENSSQSALGEPIYAYGKSVQDVLKEKDERIEELKTLVRLLEEKKG